MVKVWSDIAWKDYCEFFNTYQQKLIKTTHDLIKDVVFEWERKDGTRKRVEVKPYIDRNGAIKNYTLNGEISFDYVPFPYERKIEYTLIYDKGEFLEKKDYPLVYKLDKGVIDMAELLETDRTLWKAHFIVGEHHGKGAPDRSRKPAYD